MPTASEVMAIAAKQIGYKESPPNSNKTKYGRKFGLNGEPWCAIFEWWCGWKAAKKFGGDNPFPHNSNAAYIQDDIVLRGGTWILKKTTSLTARKEALKRYKKGDCVDFDFGAVNKYDAWRRHTGLVENVVGDYVYCIEGNTTPDGKDGSQSNGGMVCRKKRHYSQICSCARPKYDKEKSATEKILRMAKACAWEFGTPYEKRKYPTGKKKKAYAKALDAAYPNRSSWGAQTRAGASCDVAVGTVVRASGVDKHYPRGLDEQLAYIKTKQCKKHFKVVKNPKKKQMKPGCITLQIFHGRVGHTTIITGTNRVYNAHYFGKSYPVIEKLSAKVHANGRCTKSYLLIPR